MSENSSERRKSSRTQNNKSSEDEGPGSSSNLIFARPILSRQRSANKKLDTTQSVRIDPPVPLPAELNEIMEGADQDLLTFINVNSAAILQHIADSVSVSHQALLETAAAESAPRLDVQEEKRKKPPKIREEKEKVEETAEVNKEEKKEELEGELKATEVVHSVTTVAADNSDGVTPPEGHQPERERPLDLDNQPTAQPSTSGATRSRPTLRIVRPAPPHPPVIMPVVRRSETAEAKKAAAPPKEDASPDEISEKIHMDFEEMEDALSMQAAANVELIRATAIKRIAETRSQGVQLSNNQLAAQESEILKYVEVTSDTSALNLLREPPSQDTLAKRARRSAGVPPPHKRNGPPPPWAPRSGRGRPRRDDAPEILPKGTLSRPAKQNNQTLKRAEPQGGHALVNNGPHKIPNTGQPRGESNVVSSSTPTQHQGNQHVNHNVQAQEPRRDNPRIPAGVNPATPCFQYLQSLNPGKPMFRGMQHGYRERKVRTNTNGIVLHMPVQRVQSQPPVGQVLGTLPLKRNSNGDEVRVPEIRQVVIEPPNSLNGMQTGSQANKSPQLRVTNPVPNSATRQNAPSAQHLTRVRNNQQVVPQEGATGKGVVPYGPKKTVPYVPSSLRGIRQRKVSGPMPPTKQNDIPMDDPSSDPSDPPPDPAPSAEETQDTRSEAEKNRDAHIALAKEIKQEALDEEEAKNVATAMMAAPKIIDNNTPTAPAPVKQTSRPARMPGLLTQKSLYNGVQQDTTEQVSNQLKKAQQQMKQVTDEIVSNNKKQLEDNANFQQPTKVIWKKKSIIVPEFMRCELCKGLMSLWIDLCDARKKYERMFPAYKCNACPSVRSIASKFDPNEKIAEASWPSVKINAPVKLVRDFDDEVNKVIGPILERERKRKEYARKIREQERAPPRSCRNKQHHLSESFHCGCPATGAASVVEEVEDPDVFYSDTISSTTSEPQINVEQVGNPNMPNEIANIITKKIEVGDTSTYSLMHLIQKVLVTSGRLQSEDEAFDPAIMYEIPAKDFMDSMTTFLMSQHGFQNNVFVKED
ncbi:hypothetical protein CAEBREN_07974 [Caenorhabditis brenneri]|uniref:Uncharacterized protein n=1 Tax=Caenorhabditis brenneri TaxID=135651 RepID=G0MWH9_CAEBE|nr:hypothetical protein CAEBREN_07974 [Caenorhabditis brenneri]